MFASDVPLHGLSKTGKSWFIPKINERELLFLKEKYGVNDIAASLASHRLSSLEEGDEIFVSFLKNHLPDPSLLPDAEKAYQHVYQCFLEKRPLAAWGDYDVDGACSAALLVRYFRSLGMAITPYVPDRFQEGYGPNQTGLSMLKERGILDVFIVDCGTTAFDPLQWAFEQSMNVMIIDHHRASPRSPHCHAFINPKRLDYNGPEVLSTLCAGGLVFVFLVGLNRYLREKGIFHETLKEPDLLSFLDLVALSTICDMVPLRTLNRAFVKQGLKVMKRRKNIGLTALIDSAGIKEAPTPIHLGYTVGPRINAGGRIGDASLGVRLLSSQDPKEAISMAQELNILNSERQQIERQVEEEAHVQARQQSAEPFLWAMSEDWHEGVLGIIASHLKEIYYKPSFVLAAKNDFLKGSVRSVPGMDVGELIHQACEQTLLITGGGHPMAGGLTLSRDKLTSFLEFVHTFFSNNKGIETQPPLSIDMPLTFQHLKNKEFFEAMELIGPFGAGYPAPRFLCSNVRLENIIPFGHNHLRMQATQMDGARASLLFFRSADKEIGKWLRSAPSHLVDCVVMVQNDNRFGYHKANLILEDIC